MYSLIGSLVVMCDHVLAHLWERLHARCDSNTGGLGATWACAWFKNGSCTFRSHVHSSHVLHLSSATRSLILDVSTCYVICRHHDEPMNGPMSDPSMGRLP